MAVKNGIGYSPLTDKVYLGKQGVGDKKNITNELQKDAVNHPLHYNRYPIEVIDMMHKIFGCGATYNYCIMTAFKYRMRLGLKDDMQQDFAKEQWYLDKANELTTTED